MERKKYVTIVILATILMFSVLLQPNVILMVSSDVVIPPQEVSSFVHDPWNDLMYIFLEEPAEEYFDYVDVELVSLELSSVDPILDFTITLTAGPPLGLENTIFYTLMFDEDNDPYDNYMGYPYHEIDTMYTIIYSEPEGWFIERARHCEIEGWWVEETEASWRLASSWPGGLSIDILIPLEELPELTDVLPWKVLTDTFTYPSTFPDVGDFAPDEGLIYSTTRLFEVFFDDNLGFYGDELVYEQGQTFGVAVFHEIDTSVSMTVTDPNQTQGMTQLTWQQFSSLTDIMTTIFIVDIPQDAAVGDYTMTFDLESLGTTLYQQTRTWNNRFGQQQRPQQGTTIVDPDTGTSWTQRETSYWTEQKEGKFFPDGKSPGYTVPSDVRKQIKDVRESLGVDGETKPTEAANKKRKWITDNTGWVTSASEPDGKPKTPMPDGSRPRQGKDYGYNDIKKFFTRIQNAEKTGSWASGQCMDFAVLLSEMLKAEGIPARVATGVDADTWNFHCWVEMWDGSSWKVLDATPGYGEDAMDRKDYWDKHDVGNGDSRPGKVVIYDPNTDKPKDITGKYKNPRSNAPVEYDLNIFPTTSKSEYLIGEDVEINVEFENILDVTQSITYNTLVQKLPEYGRISNIIMTDPEYFVLNETGVLTIPPEGSVDVAYILDKSTYVDNGIYYIMVFTNATSYNSTDFEINSGLDLLLSAPSNVDLYEIFDVTVNITNILSVPVNDVEVFLSFPYYSSMSDYSVNVTTLAPSEVWSITVPMYMRRCGNFSIWTYASSIESGFVYGYIPVNVKSPAFLEVRNDYSRGWVGPGTEFIINSEISNLGDYPVDGVTVDLQLFEGISTGEPLTQNIGDLLAGETKVVEWTVTAENDTGYFLYVVSAVDLTWQYGDTNYGSIEVTEDMMEDLNRDNTVNIIDISLVAVAFGSELGLPLWNVIADVDCSGKVDIIDIARVAIQFGITY